MKNLIDEWLIQTDSGKKLIIIGAGSVGKLTINTVIDNNEYGINNIGILDDDLSTHGKEVLGIRVLGSIENINSLKVDNDISFVIAIANNKIRKNIAINYPKLSYTTVISKSAIVSSFSRIGKGCIVLPGVVVDPDVHIMEHVIINKSSTIAHDVILHNYTQVSPGVNFGGHVVFGESSFIGLGASILPFKKVGKDVVIGAGAAVVNDISEPGVYIGIPAKKNDKK